MIDRRLLFLRIGAALLCGDQFPLCRFRLAHAGARRECRWPKTTTTARKPPLANRLSFAAETNYLPLLIATQQVSKPDNTFLTLARHLLL
jgi:hypothetical protein